MTITKRGLQRQKIDEELRKICDQLVAVIEPAARESRYLTENEGAIYETGNARLDELLTERRALEEQPAGPAPSKNKHEDVNARLRQDKLDLQKLKGEQTDAAITHHKNAMRTRDLQKKLEAVEADQGIAERQAELDYRRRMGQLLDAKMKWS